MTGERRPGRAGITALIPCKDEEAVIRECLESVKWADEILMADSGSTDRTMDIGREYGARIIQREFINDASMKNWAIPQARHEWVMVIDCDERCTPELRDEILLELENPGHDGYRIRRRNFVLGREVRHGGWGTDEVIRLFKRDVSSYKELHVHADVVVRGGRVGRLRNRLLHYSYRNFTQYLGKMNRYSTLSAMDLKNRGRKATATNLFIRPGYRFFRMYVLQRGFLDGKMGLMICMLSAFAVFSKYLKLWSLTEARGAKEDPGREP